MIKKIRKQQKGFTIIEILGVLAIIGVLALLITPLIGRMIENSREELYDTQIENIISGARSWATNNTSHLPEEEGQLITIYLRELKGDGYVNVDIKNPRTKELFPDDMEITITRHFNNYVYNLDVESGSRQIDLEAPHIIMQGEVYQEVEINSNYEDPGVIAYGSNKVDLTDHVNVTITRGGEIVSGIDTTDFYEYRIHYSLTEGVYENHIIRTVVIVDTTPPNLIIPGDTEIDSSELPSFREMDGVSASDNSNIEPSITVSGNVSNIPGAYTLTYTAEDSKGNKTTKTRVITVLDDLPPTITIDPIGNSTWSKTHSTVVTVTDPSGVLDGSLYYLWSSESSGVDVSDINTEFNSGDTITNSSLSGEYYLWVTASDRSENIGIVRSEVFRFDNTTPTLNIPGNETITVQQVGSYNLLNGVTRSDAHSGISGSVVVSGGLSIFPTNYTINYTVTDVAGNSTTKSRIITVIDVQAPVITLNGSNPMTLNTFSPYNEPGATAQDDVDGHIPNSGITKTGSVNVNVPGTYTVTYRVTDSSGNTGTAVRTVNVIDTVNPTVSFSMNGNSSWAKSRSTNVTVSDNVAVNNSSLRYRWTTSTSTPAANTFTSSFNNGQSISTPSGVTGNYYLWIRASDTSGNTVTVRTNVFRLDNTAPSISGVTINHSNAVSDGFTITRSGSPSDNHSGLRSSKPYIYEISTDQSNWQMECDESPSACNVRGINRNTYYYYRLCVYDAVGNEACTENQRARVRYYSGRNCQTSGCGYSSTDTKNAICDSGWSRSGTTCQKEFTKGHYCPSGFTGDGINCKASYKVESTYDTSYSCSGSTPKFYDGECRPGGNCNKACTPKNGYDYYRDYSSDKESHSGCNCPGSGGKCVRYWEGVCRATTWYLEHCPNGGVLTDGKCIATDSSKLTCPSGYGNRSGTTCYRAIQSCNCRSGYEFYD